MIPIYQYYYPLYPEGTRGGYMCGLPDSVRYVVVIGGRGSAKSTHISDALVCHSDMDAYNILFTRYTMVSANVSIIPEFTDKIEQRGIGPLFDIKSDEVTNIRGGRIIFKGIMQGSRNQTARLKSIPKLKMFVLDEAEELMSESTFDTIDFSLRQKGVHSQIWMSLNPTDVTHWIYRRFFAKVINHLRPNTVRVIGDTCYIWTTYEINPYVDDAFIAQARRMEQDNPDKYRNIFLGYWNVRKEGLIYKGWEPISQEEYPGTLPQWYANDWGYSNDENALVRMCYDPARGVLYVRQVAYRKGMLVPDVARAIIEDARSIGYSPGDCLVYCDPARPENRDQLRLNYSIGAVNGDNRDKTGRIGYLQGFKVKYVGDGIGNEVSAYSWMPNPYDADTFTDKPQDGNDHLMDAINYGMTHLRRMGVMGG